MESRNVSAGIIYIIIIAKLMCLFKHICIRFMRAC